MKNCIAMKTICKSYTNPNELGVFREFEESKIVFVPLGFIRLLNKQINFR